MFYIFTCAINLLTIITYYVLSPALPLRKHKAEVCFSLTKSSVALFQCPRRLVLYGIQDLSSRQLRTDGNQQTIHLYLWSATKEVQQSIYYK